MQPILIVEDDRKTASLVAMYLEREGYQTVVAHDGNQALELARLHRPMFVILDLMLPVLDGWEVCRHLRQTSDVPILMLSAREEEVDRVSGLTLGAAFCHLARIAFLISGPRLSQPPSIS